MQPSKLYLLILTEAYRVWHLVFRLSDLKVHFKEMSTPRNTHALISAFIEVPTFADDKLMKWIWLAAAVS